MEQSADIVTGGLRARRMDPRTQARAARRAIRPPAPGRYETPVWLERSFVLPVHDSRTRLAQHALTPTGAPAVHAGGNDVPDQPRLQHAGRLVGATSSRVLPSPGWPGESTGFVRPPTPEIDYARLVRRTDILRRVRVAALAALFLGMLATAAYVVTGAGAALPLAVISTLGGCLAGMWVSSSERAPIPLLRG